MGIVQKGIGQSLISVQEFLLGSRTCTIAPAILFNTFLVPLDTAILTDEGRDTLYRCLPVAMSILQITSLFKGLVGCCKLCRILLIIV